MLERLIISKIELEIRRMMSLMKGGLGNLECTRVRYYVRFAKRETCLVVEEKVRSRWLFLQKKTLAQDRPCILGYSAMDDDSRRYRNLKGMFMTTVF
jgi:hypothetical protein